jgi:predicted ATPase
VHGRSGNLPAPVASFVGRKQALVDLQALIDSTRLLTLTGAGGIRETRLALELAHAVAARFADGAWLVELAPLAEPTHVFQAVAQALGVKEQPGRPVDDALVAALEGRDLLLVLDNCEHLVGACAELAQKLLARVPVCASWLLAASLWASTVK